MDKKMDLQFTEETHMLYDKMFNLINNQVRQIETSKLYLKKYRKLARINKTYIFAYRKLFDDM